MDYQKISADDHIDLGYLPPDLWTDRVPKELRDRAPRVEDQGDKGEIWVCDGESWGDYRGERWFARKQRSYLALDRGGVAEAGRPVDPAKRLVDMDRDGVEASVMFPPILPMQVADPVLRDAVNVAYNDWSLEFASPSPKRLLPVARVAPEDPVAATNELLRVAKTGRLQEVSFLVNDVTTSMYLEDWDPFWSAAEETGVIVSYHVGGSDRNRSITTLVKEMKGTSRPPAFDLGLSNGATTFLEPFAGLFIFGTLERHPKLKVVLAESGTGWIPAVVQEMDLRYKRLFETKSASDIGLKELPSDLFKRQVWATYQADFVGLQLIPFFGDGHMMWASDYPHPDSTWPNSQAVVEQETAHLSPDMQRKIVRDNAVALYGLE